MPFEALPRFERAPCCIIYGRFEVRCYLNRQVDRKWPESEFGSEAVHQRETGATHSKNIFRKQKTAGHILAISLEPASRSHVWHCKPRRSDPNLWRPMAAGRVSAGRPKRSARVTIST